MINKQDTMEHCLVKSGACSIVLGRGHYKNFFPDKKGKLMKITKIVEKHNEFKYLSVVRSIDKFREHYSIPEDLRVVLQPDDKFYEFAKKLSKDKSIFQGPLSCMYIDYAGDKDLFGTIEDMLNNDFSIWKSHKTILKFSKDIMTALNYLHEKKMCHLDIKPENIMINTKTKKFKLIDFGFSSVEPFKDYIYNLKGTPGYFPQYFPNEKPTKWLPKIEANDTCRVDEITPMMRNPRLVYKIDSYCFGRVLYFLTYIYEDNAPIKILPSNKAKQKIDAIIECLTRNNVYARLSIDECMRLLIN